MLVIATSAAAVGHQSQAQLRARQPSAAPFAQSWAQRAAHDGGTQGEEHPRLRRRSRTSSASTARSRAATSSGPPSRSCRSSAARTTSTTSSATPRPRLEREGDEDDALVHDPPGRELELGRQEDPGHVQGLRLHVAGLADPKNDVVGARRLRPDHRLHPQGRQADHVQVEEAVCGWQDLFGVVYPSQALAGQDFNKIWTNCICGNDGKPDLRRPVHPHELHASGQGSTLKVNPFWYGKKPKLKEVDFKIITDTNTEVQAMRGGEVDAINPTFGINLLPLKCDPRRHVQPGAGPLPGAHRHPVRPEGAAAPALAVDAAGDHDGHRPPVDHQDGLRRARRQHEAARQPRVLPGRRVVQARLREVELQPDEVARAAEEALHRRPVVSVVESNSTIWTCAGLKAKFRFTWTASNATRTTQEAIIKARAEDHRHRDRRRVAAGERRVRADRHPVGATTTSPTSRG